MAYRSYKNYSHQKSYNSGVKVASFIYGAIAGYNEVKADRDAPRLARKDEERKRK